MDGRQAKAMLGYPLQRILDGVYDPQGHAIGSGAHDDLFST